MAGILVRSAKHSHDLRGNRLAPARIGSSAPPHTKEPLMSILASPRFLRNVLLADAASCVATGAVQTLWTGALAQTLDVPAALLAGSGWFLLTYAAAVVV